ncbi:leucine carboxyl methyltransferase 1 isoform X2 [Nematostella vectensis]|nr:leucine carboxyl methyltransferase 1 isoform X2 [Nematostella vectensis]
MHTLVGQFLELTDRSCQIISLGAGFDTLFWQLKHKGKDPAVFIEVDFSSVTSRKCHSIKMRKQLKEVFTAEDNLTIDPNEVHSKSYHLIASDLRDLSALDTKFTEIGLDRDLPTLFLVECVFVYMKPEHSAALIDWTGRNFNTAIFINFEQVNMQDRFGQVMIENLKCRECTLVGALACPDIESQKQRYLSHGWQDARAFTMAEVYKNLPRDDVMRIEKLEFLDEVDLLLQLLSHYCISWAYNDSKHIGLSSVGF